MVERITLWVGVISSLVTISLTAWNARTKTRIDEAEARLKLVEAEIKTKAEAREAFKEKVTRYEWIRGLFPELIDEQDDKKRNFTISLVRFAMDPQEAAQLFAALQASSNKELQVVGQSGLTAIQNEQAAELAERINQINAPTADVRKRAVAELLAAYKSSTQAITLVLKLYDQGKIERLSASGVINGLVLLNGTDTSAWNQEQIPLAEAAINRIRARAIGPQTQAVLQEFEKHLQNARAAQKE